ncbi:unnamed protein product (macronuclear) [Paramecium tetraurelia]|uniref:Pex N-terminal domain-containing protein n=1 Tax=Paramecium tetraurelia TaxID=5888 RepID=A0DDG5_PARTE|nr:uncharacterized protein GSPATT00015941001 [Paramecium tetraurelia]CAK81082.1 unnamed protein product [Paramecium tetraurelia]|eukprot:XP_001448479.1 hypothetical protein (macronuclear) [Paramecium tetraurelia strain d4-2]
MFNTSWIAPNMQSMQLTNEYNSNHQFEHQQKLPFIPQRNQFQLADKLQFKIKKQIPLQQNSLIYQSILEINQKNKHLLKEIRTVLNQDLNQQSEQNHSYIQTQEDNEPRAKPNRRRHPSFDTKVQSDRNLDDENKFKQHRKIQPRYKNDELRNYSITEVINKRINTNEINIRDSRVEFEAKQINNIKVLTTNRLNINQKIHQEAAKKQQQNFGLIKGSVQKKKSKLRIVFYFVLAAMRFSKKYRKIQDEQNKQRNQMNQNYLESQKAIDKFSKRQAIVQEKLYYAYVAEKVIHYLKDQAFIEETQKIQNLSSEYQSDIRKLHVFKFTTLLFKNVELFTREQTISDLIRGLLNISLYEKTNFPVSKFVGQRCNFYNDHHLKIPQEQLVLIALEHYFFGNLIPQLFEILANLQEDKSDTRQKVKTSPYHLNECHFYICIFATLIQQMIIQNFAHMKTVKNPNGKIVQKTIKTTEQQNLVIKTEIVINNQVNKNKVENQEIVEGLISSDLALALEADKPQWKKLIDQTFSKIIKNFQNLLPK